MNLVWHITKKDLRRLVGPLVGLVLVALVKIFIGLVLRSGDGLDMVWFGRMSLYLNLARGAEALMNFVLVGLLVHEDALVGIHVFWRTRPISNGLVLRSKLLTGVLIFGLLPIVIALPWWLVCGYGPANMATATLEMWGWSLCIVVPASALAVLSDNLGRYISMTVVGYALGTFSLLMGLAYIPGQELMTPWGVLQSRSVISLVLILVGWLVIMAWQFGRRSLVVPQAILIFLVIVIPQVMWGWPNDIFAAWRPRQADTSEQTRDITLTTSPARIDYAENVAKTLELTLRANQVPADRVFASTGADLFWQARSGQLYASGFSPYGYSGNTTVVRGMLDLATVTPDEETARWEAEKRLEFRRKVPSAKEAPPPLSPEEARKVLTLRFGLIGTAAFEPPTLKSDPELRMDVVFARPQKLAELQLQPTGWLKIDGRNLRITNVRTVTHPAASNGMATAFLEKKVTFVATEPEGEWIAPHWHLFHIGTPMVLAPDCWLVSRELGIAHNAGPIAPYYPSVRIDGVQVVWRWASIAEPRVIRNGVWTGYLPDWDKKFSMVFFSYSLEGQFRRTVKLEQIQNNRKEQDAPPEATP